MSYYAKVPSEKMRTFFSENMIMTLYRDGTLVLMSGRKMDEMMEHFKTQKDETNRRLMRILAGNAVEIDLEDEFICIPQQHLVYMKATACERLYLAKVDNVKGGDYLLGISREAVEAVLKKESMLLKGEAFIKEGWWIDFQLEEEPDWDEEES